MARSSERCNPSVAWTGLIGILVHSTNKVACHEIGMYGSGGAAHRSRVDLVFDSLHPSFINSKEDSDENVTSTLKKYEFQIACSSMIIK